METEFFLRRYAAPGFAVARQSRASTRSLPGEAKGEDGLQNATPGKPEPEFKIMKHVYIIRSISHPDQKYIGITANIDARLKEHNSGTVPHTSKFVPWELVTYTTFFNDQKAFEFEKYLKSHSGRAFASKRFL